MVIRKDAVKSSRGQVENRRDAGARKTVITPDTPYAECSERLTAFGGLLALVKFMDLLGFEKEFEGHYVRPGRKAELGDYRMVLRMLIMLFIGFQRLGHNRNEPYYPNTDQYGTFENIWKFFVHNILHLELPTEQFLHISKAYFPRLKSLLSFLYTGLAHTSNNCSAWRLPIFTDR